MNRLDLMAVAGVIVMAVGLGLWSVALALVWLGLALITASFLAGYSNGRD